MPIRQRSYPSQIRRKIQYMMEKREHLTISGATIIMAELCGVLLGLRRSEHFASKESNPDKTTLLFFRNLAGTSWDLSDMTRPHDVAVWASKLCATEIIRVRLCYTKRQRHRVAQEVIAGPGHQLLSFIRWLKIVVMLGAKRRGGADSR